MASNAESVSIWWRHHDKKNMCNRFNSDKKVTVIVIVIVKRPVMLSSYVFFVASLNELLGKNALSMNMYAWIIFTRPWGSLCNVSHASELINKINTLTNILSPEKW